MTSYLKIRDGSNFRGHTLLKDNLSMLEILRTVQGQVAPFKTGKKDRHSIASMQIAKLVSDKPSPKTRQFPRQR